MGSGVPRHYEVEKSSPLKARNKEHIDWRKKSISFNAVCNIDEPQLHHRYSRELRKAA
jgi:hypothetical protein